MSFEAQIPFVPNLAGIPTLTTPDFDVLRSKPTNPQADYALLRRMQYLRPPQIEAIKARGHKTPIEFVILVDGNTPEMAVKATRLGLAFQAYDYVQVKILDTTHESAIEHLRTTDAPWVWFVYAGDLIAPYSALIAADWISHDPLYCAYYTDEEVYRDNAASHPFHKPDLNLEWLRATPYVGKGILVNTAIAREAVEGVQQFQHRALVGYELILRLIEKAGPNVIGHIPETLYRTAIMHEEWSSLPGIAEYSGKIVQEHLKRMGINASISPGSVPGVNRVSYHWDGQPLVSIVIPVKGMAVHTQRLITGILKSTVYPNYEIIPVVLQGQDMGVVSYIDQLASKNDKVKPVRYYGEFNYGAIVNAGVEQAGGDYICLLHPDHQIQGNDWLTTMMGYAQQPNVGVVGCKSIYPDGRLQHGGVVMGLHGIGNHFHFQSPKDDVGLNRRLRIPRDTSAVTGSGSLFKRTVYGRVGKYDDVSFHHVYTDVDFCARVVKAGYRVVWTPHVTMITDDVARKTLDDTHESIRRIHDVRTADVIRKRHADLMADDPHWNHHISLVDVQPTFASRTSVMWDPFAKPALPRIMVLPSDKSGCGLYRSRGPIDAMQQEGLAEGMSSEWMIPVAEAMRLRIDSMILQRKPSDEQLKFLYDYKEYLPNVFKVYELDDALHLIPPKSIHYGQFPADILQRQINGIRACDRFVVSTDELGNVFADFHRDIRVRKNCLPPWVWGKIQSKALQSDTIRIGWGGGTSHRGDLEMIESVIKHFHGRVTWVFFGMLPDVLKPYVKEYHSGVPIEVYPQMLASLGVDLAVAPLEDNEFNRCKSSLRILEYGACGYPVIATDIVNYRTGLPGVKLAATTDDWINLIEDAIQNRDRLAGEGQALRNAIHKDWMLTGPQLQDWLRCWMPD